VSEYIDSSHPDFNNVLVKMVFIEIALPFALIPSVFIGTLFLLYGVHFSLWYWVFGMFAIMYTWTVLMVIVFVGGAKEVKIKRRTSK